MSSNYRRVGNYAEASGGRETIEIQGNNNAKFTITPDGHVELGPPLNNWNPNISVHSNHNSHSNVSVYANDNSHSNISVYANGAVHPAPRVAVHLPGVHELPARNREPNGPQPTGVGAPVNAQEAPSVAEQAPMGEQLPRLPLNPWDQGPFFGPQARMNYVPVLPQAILIRNQDPNSGVHETPNADGSGFDLPHDQDDGTEHNAGVAGEPQGDEMQISGSNSEDTPIIDVRRRELAAQNIPQPAENDLANVNPLFALTRGLGQRPMSPTPSRMSHFRIPEIDIDESPRGYPPPRAATPLETEVKMTEAEWESVSTIDDGSYDEVVDDDDETLSQRRPQLQEQQVAPASAPLQTTAENPPVPGVSGPVQAQGESSIRPSSPAATTLVSGPAPATRNVPPIRAPAATHIQSVSAAPVTLLNQDHPANPHAASTGSNRVPVGLGAQQQPSGYRGDHDGLRRPRWPPYARPTRQVPTYQSYRPNYSQRGIHKHRWSEPEVRILVDLYIRGTGFYGAVESNLLPGRTVSACENKIVELRRSGRLSYDGNRWLLSNDGH